MNIFFKIIFVVSSLVVLKGSPIEENGDGEVTNKRFVFETPEEKRKWEDGLVEDLTSFFKRKGENVKRKAEENGQLVPTSQDQQAEKNSADSLETIINRRFEVESKLVPKSRWKLLRDSIRYEEENKVLKKETLQLMNENIGLKNNFTQLKNVVLRVGLPMYVCMKLEMYERLWNTGGPTSTDYDPIYKPEVVPDNSQRDYKKHHTEWNTILTSSKHPGAIRFRKALEKKYGAKYNGEISSRNIAISIVFLQNLKHGPAAKAVGLEFLENADQLVQVLSDWKCLEDEDLLTVVKIFEQVTTSTST